MGKKAVAFQVKATSVVGLELACGDCPVVLQVTHDRLSPLPKHRCNGKAAEFEHSSRTRRSSTETKPYR